MPLSDNTGRTIKIHYLCDGPTNSSSPTFMFEGDNSHGYADYLYLQQLLKQHNRRSCIWDKAGLGYSDYMYSDMYNNSLYYHNFVRMIDEKNIAWVAWGGGGSLVYDYLFTHSNISSNNISITLIDAYPTGIEWRTPYVLKKWSNDTLIKYVTDDMTKRFQLIFLINAFGVPLGLMNIFFPAQRSKWLPFADETRWFFLTEKTWITQRWYLENLVNETDVFSEKRLNSNIPINHIMSIKTDEQIVESICLPNKMNASSDECQYEIEANQYMINVRKELVSLTENGQVYECTKSACNQGYFVSEGAEFTVDALLKLYPN